MAESMSTCDKPSSPLRLYQFLDASVRTPYPPYCTVLSQGVMRNWQDETARNGEGGFFQTWQLLEAPVYGKQIGALLAGQPSGVVFSFRSKALMDERSRPEEPATAVPPIRSYPL